MKEAKVWFSSSNTIINIKILNNFLLFFCVQ